MTDSEIRGVLLKKYYERKRDRWIGLRPEDFDGALPWEDILHVSNQLGQQGLIDWRPIAGSGGELIAGRGHINAFGVDVIEGNVPPPISINFDYSRNVSVVASPNTQIGDGNVQNITLEIQKIITAIDHSTASEAQKKEAKSLLSRFLEHPLVASIAGGIASTFKA